MTTNHRPPAAEPDADSGDEAAPNSTHLPVEPEFGQQQPPPEPQNGSTPVAPT